jgi:hypothetical protein
MTEYIVWAIVHLGCWALMLTAAGGLGHLFLRRMEFDSRVERVTFTLTLGLGLSALVIFIIGIAGLLYREVLWALTVAGALATLVYLARAGILRSLARPPRLKDYYSLPGAVTALLILAALGYWLVLLVTTQYPPVHWDAISHHLVLCREYLANHRIVVVAGIPHPLLPALNHMHFTWGLALQDEILAQMMEHAFLMLTSLGLYSWGKRERRPLLGVAAAAFYLGNPLVLWLGEAAYVDVCLVCFVLLGVYALLLFWRSTDARWWYLSMALLGLAAGIKLPGLFFIIVGSLLGLWKLARPYLKLKPLRGKLHQDDAEASQAAGRRFTVKALAWGWALAFILLIPWYAFIFYHTGNPIWPTFPQYSRGPWGDPGVVANTNNWLANAAEPRTVKNFLLLSLDWIRYPSTFYAEVGLSLFPLIVIWPIAWVVALWNRSVRWWALWALSFTLYWFMFPHQLRYWLPALPLAILALLESIRWAAEKLTRSRVAHAAVWIAIIIAAGWYGWRSVSAEIKTKGWPPANEDARKTFISSIGGYNGARYINKQASSDDVVCMIGASWLNYYIRPQVLDLYGLLQSRRFPNFQWPDDAEWVRWLESRNVKWIYVYHANPPDYLKIPKRNIVLNPIWPDYELVYADPVAWVFRHKPVPAEVW